VKCEEVGDGEQGGGRERMYNVHGRESRYEVCGQEERCPWVEWSIRIAKGGGVGKRK
jgi:hypothetical protein